MNSPVLSCVVVGTMVAGVVIVTWEMGTLVKDYLLGKWEAQWQKDTFDE